MQKMMAPDSLSGNCRMTDVTEKQEQDHRSNHLAFPDF